MTLYLLDTNAVSDLVRHPVGSIAQRVGLVGSHHICTSIIVTAEIRYGVSKRSSAELSARVKNVLDALLVLPFEEPADRVFADLRNGLERVGQPISEYDLLIAAHALALNCILVTDNEGEFRRIPDLRVENWLRAS